MARSFWLMKSEPDVYSIDDLAADEGQTTCWDGVRNYQARNFMRDSMKVGDQVLFYHSNADPSGVAGIASIAAQAYADPTAFDKKDKHYDAKSDPDNPAWMMVDVKFVKRFSKVIPLSELKTYSQLDGMELLRRGSRLSVQPVEKSHFDFIVKLGAKRPKS